MGYGNQISKEIILDLENVEHKKLCKLLDFRHFLNFQKIKRVMGAKINYSF